MTEQCRHAIAISGREAVPCKLDKGHIGAHKSARGHVWDDSDPASGSSPSQAMANYQKEARDLFNRNKPKPQREEREEAFGEEARRILRGTPKCGDTFTVGGAKRHCDRYRGHPDAHGADGYSWTEETKHITEEDRAGIPLPEIEMRGTAYDDEKTVFRHGDEGRYGHALFYRWKHRGARNREMKPDPDWRMPSE